VEAGERPWKIVYVVLCLVLLAFTAVQIVGTLLSGSAGVDYRVFVGAVQALDHGQNPYILENIIRYNGGQDLLFIYPPHTLYFFWLLDFFYVFHYFVIYYLLLTVLLILSGYLIVNLDQKRHYFFLTTLLLTGFISTFWNFATGNKDILFLFLFAIIFTLLMKEKYWQSSVVMGLSAAVSLTTGPFIALYLVVRRPILDRLTYIGLSLGVVLAAFLVSYCVNPSFFFSYLGTLKGSSSPFLEPGGMNIPTPYLMFRDLLNSVSSENILPLAIVSCVYIGLILYATWNYYLKHNGDALKLYSLVMLSIFMMLPRIKPYDFIILVVPLYILFKDCRYWVKTLVLAVISLPSLFIWYSLLFNIDRFNLPFLLGTYTQAYSLLLIFLVAILQDYLTPCSPKVEKDGEKPPGRNRTHGKKPAQQESFR
jgi:hypothetical protein